MHFNYVQCKQKGFAPILVVLIIALGIGGYLFYTNSYHKIPSQNSAVSQTPESTWSPLPTPTTTKEANGWKKYTNTKLSYSISFPANYSISNEGVGDGGNAIALMSPLNPDHGKGFTLAPGELKIELAQSSDSYNGTIDDLIQQNREDKDSNDQLSELKKVTLNGMEAMYSKDKLPNGGEVYKFIHNKHVFTILKFPLETSRQGEFEQILATFNFTP